MLRMYLLQVWFNLSDEGIEDAIYDSYAFRKFMGINFVDEQVPDATTLLKFRHLLEKNHLGEQMFKAISYTSAAAEGVRHCDRLFALEREYDGKDKEGKQIREPLSPEEKHSRRNEETKPLLDNFFKWLMTVNPAGGSKLVKAVQNTLNEKRYLYGFLDDPGVEISNNRAENAIRPFVVGRKNWLFSDSPKGASASAMLYSLVVSAKMNGLNAEKYLIRLFRSPDPVLPYETT